MLLAATLAMILAGAPLPPSANHLTDPMLLQAQATLPLAEPINARRACRPGTRWSTYHRKCVLWLPLTPA